MQSVKIGLTWFVRIALGLVLVIALITAGALAITMADVESARRLALDIGARSWLPIVWASAALAFMGVSGGWLAGAQPKPS